MFTFGRRQFQKSCPKGAPKTALGGPRRGPRSRFEVTYHFSRLLNHHGALQYGVDPRVRHQRFHNFSPFFLSRDLWPLHALPSQSASKLVGPIARLWPSTLRSARPEQCASSPGRNVGPTWPNWARAQSGATKAAVSNGARRLVGRRPQGRRRLAGEGGSAGTERRHL